MAIRFVGVESTNPELPASVIQASEASEQEVVAGTARDRVMTPAATSAKLPWPDVREWGVRGDGETDDSAALQAALDDLGVVHLRSDAVYVLEQPLTRTADTAIYGHGATIVQAFNGNLLTVNADWGEPTAISSLTETTHQFPDSSTAIPAVEVDMGASHTLAAGDTVRLLADDNFLGGTTGEASTRTAQFFVVGDVDGTKLYLPGRLRDPMTTGLRIVHVPDTYVELYDLRIVADSLDRTSPFIDLAGVRPTIRNIRFLNAPGVGFRLVGCHGIDIDGIDAAHGRNTDSSTYFAYLIRAEACEGGVIRGVRARQFRHAFTSLSVNLQAQTEQVKSMGRTADIVVSGEGIDCYHAPWDTHEASWGVTFDGAIARQSRSGLNASRSIGFQLRGRHDSCVGCTADGVEIGYRVIHERPGNAAFASFEGCKAINTDIGLYVDDNEDGTSVVSWKGGQIHAHLHGVRTDATGSVMVDGAEIVLAGAAAAAYLAAESSTITVKGGSVDTTLATGTPKFAAATTGSRVEVDGTRLRGTFAELADSTRAGTTVIRDLDVTHATINAMGGSLRAPAVSTHGWDYSGGEPYPNLSDRRPVLGATVWDTFHRDDGPLGSLDSGGTWTEVAAGLEIVNHRAAMTASSGSSLVTTAHTDSDGTVEATVVAFGDAGFAGLVFRYVDANNLLYAEMTESQLRLRRRLAGTFSSLAVANMPRIDGEPYLLIAEFDGPDIAARVLDSSGRRVAGLTHTLTGGDETTFGSSSTIGMRVGFDGATALVAFANFIARS